MKSNAPGTLYLYDKNLRPIHPRDVLKVFHFNGVRGKKYYMYKLVDRCENGELVIKHLSSDGEYRLALTGAVLSDYEIVQGYAGGQPFQRRKRLRVATD